MVSTAPELANRPLHRRSSQGASRYRQGMAINRREFLQALAALGTTLPIQGDLAAASLREVDDALAALANNPQVFHVDPYDRTLTTAEVSTETPARRELWDVFFSVGDDSSQVVDQALHCEPLQWEIERWLEGWDWPEDVDPQDWREALHELGRDQLDEFIRRINVWLDQKPKSSWELDVTPQRSTPQGDALWFFRQLDPDSLAELGIEIVEGEHPGSSYYAAELPGAVAEANEHARRLGLPIRFAEGY